MDAAGADLPALLLERVCLFAVLLHVVRLQRLCDLVELLDERMAAEFAHDHEKQLLVLELLQAGVNVYRVLAVEISDSDGARRGLAAARQVGILSPGAGLP